MDNKEAIETLELAKAKVEWDYPLEYAAAMEMAKAAIEKRIPIAVMRKSYNMMGDWAFCSACQHALSESMEFCPTCGQALDWSDDGKET